MTNQELYERLNINEKSIFINGKTFKDVIIISNSLEGKEVRFLNCVFESVVRFNKVEFKYLDFNDCKFISGIIIDGCSSITEDGTSLNFTKVVASFIDIKHSKFDSSINFLNCVTQRE